LSDQNSVPVWRSLNREMEGQEIPELCHVLSRSLSWEMNVKALLLLNYSAVRPEGAPWQSLILHAIENHLVTSGHVQDVALRLIQKLRVERREVWRCLYDALQMTQDGRAAYGPAKLIADFTSPAEVARTGAMLVDLFFFFEESTHDEAIKSAIAALSYRAAIPALRAVFARYAKKKNHYKVMYASDLLAEWDDKGAAPEMRSYIDAMYRESISTTYFHVMKALYRLEGHACASYLADRVLSSSPANQHHMTYWDLQVYKNEPEIVMVVTRLAGTTQDQEL